MSAASAVAEAPRKETPSPAPSRSTAPSRAARERVERPRAEKLPPNVEETADVGPDAEPGKFAAQLEWLAQEKPSDKVSEAVQKQPPDVARAEQVLRDVPPEQQRQLLQDLAQGDGRDLMKALGAEGVTDDQRAAVLDELSRLTASVGDPALTKQLGATLAGVLEGSDFTGEVADALKKNLSQGGDAGLAVEMVRAAGKTVATKLSDMMAEGFKSFYNRTQSLGEKVAKLNGDLGYLVQNFGPMMSEDELQKAIADFKSKHSEFAQLDALGGAAVSNIEHVQQFEALVNAKVDPQKASEIHRDINLTKASGAAALALPTEGAQKAVGDLLAREGRGEETWLSNLDRCAAGDVTQGAGLFKNAMFNTAITQAAAAGGERGHDILKGLADTGGIPGLTGGDASRVAEDLNRILSSKDPAALDASLKTLNETLGVLGDGIPSATLGRLKTAGAGLGIAGIGLSGYQLADHPSLRNLATFLADGTEFAAEGVPKIEAMLAKAFGKGAPGAIGSVAGGVGVLMSVWDAGNAFARGDVTSGLLSMGSAFGSGLALVGATGAGLLIGGAALIGSVALDAYRRTQEANHFESQDTRDFLRYALADAGLSSDEMRHAVDKLSNADGEGRLNGILIQQAAAQLGLDSGDLLNRLSHLPPGTLNRIMEHGHGVDPQDDSDLTSLDPRKVAEWVNYLRQQGLPLPC